MAADIQAAAEALQEGKAYERAERERRIGVTYVVHGLTTLAIFGAYGLLDLSGWSVPSVVWALLWLPFTAAATLYRERAFRRLPTKAEDILSMPRELWWVFVAGWVAAGVGLGGELRRDDLATAAIVALFGLMYLVQARYHKDRLHAALGVGVLAFAIVVYFATTSMGVGFLLVGVGIGVPLVALGIVRARRAG